VTCPCPLSAVTWTITAGAALLTLTWTGDEVVTLPDPSVARTARLCGPFETVAVFQFVVYGAVASVAMRHILVDRARARATSKHGAGLTRVSLDGDAIAVDDEPDVLLTIDAALDRLAELSPRLARIVELRFYGGLSDGEVAAELGVTVRTVQRDWTKARLLLERVLES